MSDYLDPNNEELLKDFFSEAQMQVDTLEQNILVLENEGANKDAVDEIFRAAHTLKGGSATVEMMELSRFTHIVEDVLDAIRSDHLAMNEDVVDILLSAIDVIKEMLEQRMDGSVYQEDTSEIAGRLTALLSGKDKGKSAAASPAKAASPAPAVKAPAAPVAGHELSEAEFIELKDAVDGGLPIVRVVVKFDESSLMNTVGGIQVYAVLKGIGTVLKTIPEFEQLYEDNFFPTVEYFIASSEDPSEIRRSVLIPDVSLGADVALITGPGRSTTAQSKPAVAPVTQVAKPVETAAQAAPVMAAASAEKPAAAATSEDAKKAGREAGSILRVDSKRIDDLLNLVSETVITKAAFNQISSQFGGLQTELHNIEG